MCAGIDGNDLHLTGPKQYRYQFDQWLGWRLPDLELDQWYFAAVHELRLTVDSERQSIGLYYESQDRRAADVLSGTGSVKDRQALTLIELLVVIDIIAILATMRLSALPGVINMAFEDGHVVLSKLSNRAEVVWCSAFVTMVEGQASW